MPSATAIQRTAKQAGLLYLAMSLFAMLDYFYLRGLFVVSGDAAATARNILAQEQLYRIEILVAVGTQVLFILVALTLYRLFEDVDRHQARVMLALVGTGIAGAFASIALNATPLVFLSGDEYLSVFGQPQLEALSYAALRFNGKQHQILTFLWGLWLFPFGILILKSGFLPKFLGVLLLVTGIAYVASSIASVGFPDAVAIVRKIAFPLYFGEFIVVLWLAFLGAKPRAAGA